MVCNSGTLRGNEVFSVRRNLDADESAVSPVIATVLLLAITVLLLSLIHI